MFIKHENSKQLDMFSSAGSVLSERALKKLNDENAWQNVFRKYCFDQIDEEIYKFMFCADNGRPNQSVKVMLGMMILKEAFGYTDERLFEACDFNICLRQAIGLFNLNEDRPSDSTYYEFRAKIAKHLAETGEDLIEMTFNGVTSNQLETLDISGKKVRMDSKLLQSNIAKMNRLQLILESLRVVVRSREKQFDALYEVLNEEQLELITQLGEKSTSNITYGLKKEDKNKLLLELGIIIKAMVTLKIVTSEDILYKVYKQHYEEKQVDDEDNGDNDEQIGLIASSEIPSNSIQSPHDEDATYRVKGKEQNKKSVNGFHSNITEICDEIGKPNLITHVETTGAHISEADYLQEASQETQELLGADKKVDELIADGGYDSIANKLAFSAPDHPELKLVKQKGSEKIYVMSWDVQGNLRVYNKKTKKVCEVRWSENAQKYIIIEPNKSPRYMTPDQVNAYIESQKIEASITKKDQGLRAYTESTIHQVFCKLGESAKIRYRGLIKSHWFVLTRSMAVNIARIKANFDKLAKIDALLPLNLLSRLRRAHNGNIEILKQQFIFKKIQISYI